MLDGTTPVTVVNTTAYNALLGMEFTAAIGGCYDTYNKFWYRQVGLDGLTQSFEISTPCHLSSLPLIACAFFGDLIRRKNSNN